MSEKRLWEWLGGVLPPGHYSRIESGDTAPGFPDVDYQILPNHTGKIELKFARDPKAKIPFSNKHGIRKSQRIWIRDNIRNGGIVWIIAEVTPAILCIPGECAALINGSSAADLVEMATLVCTKEFPEGAAAVFNTILKGE
jgi:hypothetical protein